MTARRASSRTLGAGLIQLVDDFMSWLLYGYETWLVALLKGVPLFLFVYLLLIPLLAFNMAGGTFVPLPGQNPFPLQALAFGTLVAGLGLVSLVYLFFEFRRVTRREALLAESRSTALQTR